ncbi:MULTISPECIES: NAD-dependent epimerase/dehydratase family protein [unclassified Polaromonas]|uniref:NAD-dependent epimerase/dehydratase family protein n=1 Tax=unclassified Polaromonas TaxID=2638319 RepID=UPI00129D51D3|nr:MULTISPECIES: NAD-dependent epimerase/dehydratase family protein [unclassified Polaromonas]QGJ19731.1 NAD(P)H-binding protein [Polaromonas sp. Pch-P]
MQPHPENSPKSVATGALRVLVLGGTGFIGRHAVAALHAAGAQLAIGSRHPERHEAAYPFAALHRVRFEHLLQPDAWAPLLKDVDVDVVVNCVGILRQRPRESYDHVHHRAPVALAVACAGANIRLVHTSALGLHEGAKSRFLSSKLLGERAIAATGCDHAIVRPSLLDGEGGFGARWLRGLSRSPVHFIPRGARGGIAAMAATDLGKAFAALAAFPSLAGHREVELGGTRRYGYAEYLRELRADYTGTRALQIPLPNWAARVGAHVCDVLHFSPFSYGHWILLQRDNMPSPNRLPELLGREPLAIRPGSHPKAQPGTGQGHTGKIGPHDLPDTPAG